MHMLYRCSMMLLIHHRRELLCFELYLLQYHVYYDHYLYLQLKILHKICTIMRCHYKTLWHEYSIEIHDHVSKTISDNSKMSKNVWYITHINISIYISIDICIRTSFASSVSFSLLLILLYYLVGAFNCFLVLFFDLNFY